MELSQYERKRLENIRHNQQVLRDLEIPQVKLVPTSKPKTVAVMRQKRARQEPVEPTRRSTRLIERETGVKMTETVTEPTVERKKEREVRRPIITSRVQFAPTIGANEDFLNSFGMVQDQPKTCPPKKHYAMRHEHCIIKAARDRIYSMAIHPQTDQIIACAGTKEGELAFWNCTEVLDEHYKVEDDWTPKAFLFSPHAGAISNLRFNPLDNSRLLTTGYDGTCLTMDLQKGTFSPWFTMPKGDDDAVVTGFDLYDNLALHSDTAGMLRITDLRCDQLVNKVRLHENKIGGVSVSCDGVSIASCSNDRTVAVWDFRKLTPGNYKHRFDFKNAVTAVNFHPQSPLHFVSTCYDDTVRIYNLLDTENAIKINHNNQTGRWITLFKAIWDPKSTVKESVIAIGNMEQRGVDLYEGAKGEWLQCATGEWLTAQPAVNAFHTSLPIMVSGNASGKMVVWS